MMNRYVYADITLQTLLLGMMLCSKEHNIHSVFAVFYLILPIRYLRQG